MSEKILIVGGGAREHALAHKLSNFNRKIFVTPGNAGINQEFECIKLQNYTLNSLISLSQKISPDLVVIGPENYLAQGIIDRLEKINIPAFGPTLRAAQLETKKSFMKKICSESGVKTARYDFFDSYEKTKNYILRSSVEKMVIKADGLCGGKGVTIVNTKEQALSHIDYLFNGGGFEKLGCSEKNIIIEDFLLGYELSVFGVVAANDVVLFAPMQDYKRQKDNNQGPNTGGMGAYGPVKVSDGFLEQIKQEIFLPVINRMREIDCEYRGLLYAGLMITEKTIHVLEFNCRFGDPETQALLFGLKPDIYDLLHDISMGKNINSSWWQKELLKITPCVNLVLASKSYPLGNDPAMPINIQNYTPQENCRLYFASTKMGENNKLCAGSGRVLNIVARDSRIEFAQKMVYECATQISFSGCQYRNDIGLIPDDSE